MSNKAIETEDLAIQSTLSMTVEERLELLANLIVEKIIEDQQNNYRVLTDILRPQES